jgi:two-component system, cell cycle sensor histidine kinase and response regulator CckA
VSEDRELQMETMQSELRTRAINCARRGLGSGSARGANKGCLPQVTLPPPREDSGALCQLVAGIAHDYNNLVTCVICGAALAKSKLAPDHPAREALDVAAAAGEQAAALTRQLMDYAGISPFAASRVNLSELAAEVAASFHATIPQGVRLSLDLCAGLPPIWADSGQMERLVEALIANAVEAIPDGMAGTVSVRTRVAEIDGDRDVQLIVGDTGCGMDDGMRRRIFEAFFSTKFLGRGMGLAAAAGIVRAHHGAIQVRSEPGSGSVFTVCLPAAAPTAAPWNERSGNGEDTHCR